MVTSFFVFQYAWRGWCYFDSQDRWCRLGNIAGNVETWPPLSKNKLKNYMCMEAHSGHSFQLSVEFLEGLFLTISLII